MSAASPVAAATVELESINAELAALLHAPQAELTLGAEASLADELVLCGLLGGKDVGKTTLINALAGAEVSCDRREVGPGTDHPIAFVHEEVRAAVEHRLRGLLRDVPIDLVAHRADAVRHAVLVDLPDFDSDFAEHLEVVRAIAPLLDRVLWVLTPRKIGDRAWVAMFHRVVKDPSNVLCVLNKFDELLADAAAFACRNGDPAEHFWLDQGEWMTRVIRDAGCPYDEDFRFLVAAAYPAADVLTQRIAAMWDDPSWQRFAEDRPIVQGVARRAAADLQRLRQTLLAPISREQAERIKHANRGRELSAARDELTAHYDLARTREELAAVLDPGYQQDLLNEAFGPAYCTTVAERIKQRLRPDTELADELLERRVEHWPLLRLVYWPFGWLARTLARRAAGPPAEAVTPAYRDPAEVDGRGLLPRAELLRSRLLADHAPLARQLVLESSVPPAAEAAAAASSALDQLSLDLNRRLIDDIRQRDRHPSVFSRLGIWLLALWFPLIQPATQAVLEAIVGGWTVGLAEAALQLVRALSASRLLLALAMPAVLFLLILAAMYARALRAVRRARTDQDEHAPLADAIDQMLIANIVTPALRPFQQAAARLESVCTRLDRLR